MHQYIKVSGTPYERGFQYGSQAKERIRKVIEEYKVLFEKEAFITWDKAYELSKPYRKEIEKYRRFVDKAGDELDRIAASVKDLTLEGFKRSSPRECDPPA